MTRNRESRGRGLLSRRVMHGLNTLALLLRRRDLSRVLQLINRQLYSVDVSVGLSREVSVPFDSARMRLSLTIRPIEPDDIPWFTDVSASNLDQASVAYRDSARFLIDSGIQTCYIAVTPDGQPCYMQYLIDPRQNVKLRELYGDLLPHLSEDEGLLESAFSLEKYRGRGLMLYVIPELAKKARELGLRRLIVFVSVKNLPMLKGCKGAGFAPYVERKVTHRLFRRRVIFTPLVERAGIPVGPRRGARRGRAEI
jgi:hypothetical protein